MVSYIVMTIFAFGMIAVYGIGWLATLRLHRFILTQRPDYYLEEVFHPDKDRLSRFFFLFIWLIIYLPALGGLIVYLGFVEPWIQHRAEQKRLKEEKTRM